MPAEFVVATPEQMPMPEQEPPTSWPLLHKEELPLLAAMTLGAVIVLACLGVSILPAAAYVRWLLGGPWRLWAALFLPVAWVIWGVTLAIVCVTLRWVLLPRIPEGTFAANSSLVIRWGIVHRLTHFAQRMFMGQLANTPWVNAWFRALGARIGSGVALNSMDITDWDLVSIGRGSMVGFGAGIQAHSGERTVMRFARVSLGANSQVGRSAMIFDGVAIGEGAVIAPGSFVPPGKQLAGNRVWCGVPARRATGARADSAASNRSEAESQGRKRILEAEDNG